MTLKLPHLLEQHLSVMKGSWPELEPALQALLDGMQLMLSGGADPAQLAYVHGAVIDALVELYGAQWVNADAVDWCKRTIEAMQDDHAMLAAVSKADPQAIQWVTLIAMTQISYSNSREKLAVGLLKGICLKPGTTLGHRIETTIKELLNRLLFYTDASPNAPVAGQLVALYGSLVALADTRPLPLNRGLLNLMNTFVAKLNPRSGPNFPDPGVGDLDVLRGILTGLIRDSKDRIHLTWVPVHTEQTFLSSVAKSTEGLVPSKGQSLAFIGYVHLAKKFHAMNDSKGMLQMLVAALAHLPTDAAERAQVLPEYTDFINSLRRAGDLPDQLAQLMREKGV